MTECKPTNVLQELIGLLSLEKVEENIYRGQSQDLGYGNVFGGQVLGQALSAASRTVDHDLTAHRYMLAYASDFHLVSTALYPHGKDILVTGYAGGQVWIIPSGSTGISAWMTGCSM